MKNHRVIIDMTNNFLAFWPSHYIHIGAAFPNTLSQLRLPVKIAVVKIEKDITTWKMIKRGSKKIWPIFCKCQINCLAKRGDK